jgi:hypothetical protein
MASAKVKIGVNPSDFNGISTLAHTVVAQMTLNIANFPTPNPTLVTLNAHSLDLDALIATWGPVGNRGSHADYVALLAETILVYNLLISEAAYVQNLVPLPASYATQAAFIALSGFSVKNLAAPQGLLQAPQDLIREMSASISEDNIMLNWKKPLGLTSPNNVKSYAITIGGTQQPFIITKTKFLLDGVNYALNHGSIYEFTVIAFNDNGPGAPSATLTVNF